MEPPINTKPGEKILRLQFGFSVGLKTSVLQTLEQS